MALRNIGPFELLIVLAIVLLLFGVGRLGELGAAMGKAIRNFRKELSGTEQEGGEEEINEGEGPHA
jgi:sec-independent protein translocase protein TatA